MTDSAEIQNIKKLITDTSGECDRINKKLDDHISGEKIQKDIVKTLRIQQLQDCLNRLLQKEVNRLVHQESHCKTLCACEIERPNKQLETFIKYLDISNPIA